MKTKSTNRFLGLLRRFLGTSAIVISFFGMARAADQTWNNDGPNNNWNSTDANWDAGVTWTTGNTAIFGGTGETVTLTEAVSANGLTFNASGYTISGNTLTLTGATPTITTNADATISSTLAGTVGMTKTGSGQLSLGTNSVTGGITVSGGTLRLGSASASASYGTSAYVIAEGARLRAEYATTDAAATNVGTITWGNFSGAGTFNIFANGTFDYIANDAALPAGFTGTLHIEKGRVQTPGAAGAGLGGATKLVINSGGHLGMWNNTASINGSVSLEIAGFGYGEGGYESAIRMANGGNTSTINGPILLTAPAAISAGGTGVINGVISGSSSANFTVGPQTGTAQGGTVALAAANLFEGTTTVTLGTLRLDHQNALQNSTLTGSAGAVTFNSTVVGNAFTLGGLSGARNLTLQNTSAAPIALSVGNNNANTTYGGTLAGSGSLVKIGSGTLTLTGAANHTGGTTISAGELEISSADARAVGNLSGGGTFLKSGSGALTLTGSNYTGFTGDFGVLAGTLVTSGFHEFGAGANFVLLEGTTLAPAVMSDDNAPIIVDFFTTPDAPGTATIDLTKATINLASEPSVGNPVLVPFAVYGSLEGGGLDSLDLIMPRNYTGTLVDDQGIIGIGVTAFHPTIWTAAEDGVWDVDTTANWKLNNVAGTFQNGDATLFNDSADTGAVTLDSVVSPSSIEFANNSLPYSISGTGTIGGLGGIVKSGTATVTLATNNTFAGPSTIGEGTLAIGHANALGATGAASGTTVETGATLDLNGIALAAETITLNGGALVNNSATATTTAAPVTLGSAAMLAGTGTFTLAGAVTGTGGLSKVGSGTVNLSTQKTYTGGTIVGEGVLALTGGGGEGGTIRGDVTVESGATLRFGAGDVTGYGTGIDTVSAIILDGGTLDVPTTANQTLGNASITMAGASITGVAGANIDFFTNASAVTTLASATSSVVSGAKLNLRRNDGVTFNIADGAAAFDLDIQSSISSAGGFTDNNLTKTGPGTMRIAASTYAGGTIVSGGTLIVPSAQSSAFYEVANGATLNITGAPGSSFATGSLTLGSSGATTLGVSNFGGQVSPANAPVRVTSALTLNGTTTLNIGGTFPASGAFPVIAYPVEGPTGSGSFVLGSVPRSLAATLEDNAITNTLDFVIAANNPVTWTGATNGTWNTATANWKLGATPTAYQEGDIVLMDDSATGTTAITMAAPFSPTSLTVNNTTKAYSIGGAGLAGTAALLKSGSGVLTLTGSHQHAGGTFVNGGTLQLGDGTTDGSVSGGIVNNASLVLSPSGAVTLPGAVSGTGSLNKTGTGTATLSTAPTYTGATLVSAGNLVVPSLASPSITTNAALTFNQVSTSLIDPAGIITGTGTVAYTGPAVATSSAGQFQINDANTYSGGTTVTNARAATNNALGLGSGPVMVNPGGQVYFTALMQFPNPMTLNGTGWTEPTGLLGAIRLNGNPDLTGTITLGSDTRISSWGGNGTISGEITGTGNLEFTGSGNGNIINLKGTAPNTYVGTTTLRSGSLILDKASGAAITGNIVMDNAGVNPVLAFYGPNQLATEPVLSFINTGNNGHVCLYGNTVTFRGISSAGGGVVQNSQVVGGAGQTNVPATVVINTPVGESYSFINNVYIRNQVGQLNLVKNGMGTQTVGGGIYIDYNGTTDINAGELHFFDMDDSASRAITIASGATLRVTAVTRAFNGNVFNNSTWSGGGNIIMAGTGIKQFNGGADTFIAMGAGTTVDLQEGVLRLGFGNRVNFSANKANLNVAAGATFNTWDTPTANEVRFNALTGMGTVTRGYTPDVATSSTGIGTFVMGVNNGTGTFGGVIADGVSNAGSILNVVKRGSGIQTLTGVNTYRGTTRIEGGALALSGDGDLTGTTAITVLPGALLDASAKTTPFTQITGRSLTAGRTGTPGTDLAGDLTTGGTVNVAGWATAGTLSLNGDLALTGGGALQLDLSASAAAGNDVVAVTGDLSLTGVTTVTPAFLGGVPDTNPYTILTYTGSLSGDATNFASGLPADTRYSASFDTGTTGQVKMTISGTGENLVWSGATGDTWNTATTPLLWNADAAYFQNLDRVTFDDTADGAGAVTVNLVTAVQPGGITVNNPTRDYTISGANGVIAGGGALTKRGSGTLTLAQPNTFTGGTTVVGGTVTLTNVAAAGTGPITLSHPDTDGPIMLKANVGSGSFANPITVSANGTGTVTIDQDNALSALTGTLTLNRATTIEGGPDRTGIAGKITGNVGTLTFTGVRTTLDNTVASDFTGNIEIAGAAVVQTNAMPNCLPPTASVNISGTGRFQLNNGHAQAINALTGGTPGTTGAQIIAGSATTLTVGAGNGGGTFNGNIVNGAAALSLVKSGTGTQTLGGDNNFTGTTRITGGILRLAHTNALRGTTLVWNNEGGALEVDPALAAVNIGNITGAQDLAMPATVTNLIVGTGSSDHQTYSGKISLPGANAKFTKRGTSNLILTGNQSNEWTGDTEVITESTAPTVQSSLHFAKTGGAKAVPANTVVKFGTGTSNGTQANLRMDENDQFGSNVVMVFGNPSTPNSNWCRLDLRGTTQTLAGIVAGNLATLGGAVIQGRGLDVVSSGPSTLILNGNVDDPNYPVGGYVYRGYLRDADSGANSLWRIHVIKEGTGTQVLAGDQLGNHSGTFTVNGGTLEITNGTAGNGNTASPLTTVNDGGTLVFSGTDNTSTGTVRGTVTVNAGGTLRGTKVNAFGWDGNRITVLNINGGKVETTANGDQGWGIAINMTGGELASVSPGRYTLGGGSSVNVLASADQALISGQINTREGNANNTIPFNVADGAQDIDLLVSGPIVVQTGGVGITKNGEGKMTSSGVNTYTGNTVVNAGTLEFASGSQLTLVLGAASGTTTSVSGTGTVAFNGAFSINTTAANALETGTWTLVDVTTLTESFGASFSVTGYTDQGDGIWTRIEGSKMWTFDEGTGILTLGASPDPFFGWAASYGLTGANAEKSADPDGDGWNNLLEFATASDPTNGGSGPRVYPLMHTIGGENALTYTLAVRAGAVFAPAANPNEAKQTAAQDMVVYTVEASDNLSTWNVVQVSEVTGADAAAVQAALGGKLTTPPLDGAWTWRTFRTVGGAAADPEDFVRLQVAEQAP